jgi:hypothetical protein
MTMKIGIGWNLSTKISACLRANGLKRAAAQEQGTTPRHTRNIEGLSQHTEFKVDGFDAAEGAESLTR